MTTMDHPRVYASAMSDQTPESTAEPLPEQALADQALFTAAVNAKSAALAFMRAMSGLRDAVAIAHTAGISRERVFRTVMDGCDGNIPADVIASLRKILRSTYNA